MQTPLLNTLTTLRLGGAADRLQTARSEAELVEAVRAADAAGHPLLVLAGGSNVVIADAGFPGTVVHLLTRGIERRGAVLDVQAGEPWEPFVSLCVAEELAGVECLSGIPGSVGATPIQNVGAYGQDVAQTIEAVRVLDRRDGEVREMSAEECGFAYRSSVFKRTPGRWVVLAVRFALEPSASSRPIVYAELARRLGVEPGERAPLAAVREAVLALRRAKGMVLDPEDLDSVSAGSFFTNPFVEPEQLAAVEERAGQAPPAWPQPDGRVKTSAAWLIERAGFARGHGDPGGIAISSKHTLALTNRGAGSAEQLLALALEIREGVHLAFGIDLDPEPVLIGLQWPASERAS